MDTQLCDTNSVRCIADDVCCVIYDFMSAVQQMKQDCVGFRVKAFTPTAAIMMCGPTKNCSFVPRYSLDEL